MKAIFSKTVVTAVSYFFMVLFMYAAVSKMRAFENFQVQLAQSPLLSAYAGFISYIVIALELLIAGVLVFPKTRRVGLYASFGLMVAFTVYIDLILNYSDFVPCSCGGILEKMGWTEHLIFNVGCVVMAFVAIVLIGKEGAIHFRQTAAVSSLIFVISVGGMVALFLSSEYIIKKENNFTRRFLQKPISEKQSLILDENRYYFAGIDHNRIYLGNVIKPLILTSVDLNLQNLQTLKIEPEMTSMVLFKNLQVQVKAGYFYLFDGTVPIIYRGVLSKPEAKIISRNEAFFTQIQIRDSLRFLMRSQSSKTHQYVLTALDRGNHPALTVHDRLLEKQIDGVFDVDGILKANDSTVVYIYYYRNEFLVMSPQLKLLRTLHTIDSTKTAKISVTEISNGSRKLNAPPMKVNRKSMLYKNLLFVESTMRGQYESRKEWDHNTVIDIYRTDTQNYLGSFRVKKKKKEIMSDLFVSKDGLYVVQDNTLKRYGFNKSLGFLIR